MIEDLIATVIQVGVCYGFLCFFPFLHFLDTRSSTTITGTGIFILILLGPFAALCCWVLFPATMTKPQSKTPMTFKGLALICVTGIIPGYIWSAIQPELFYGEGSGGAYFVSGSDWDGGYENELMAAYSTPPAQMVTMPLQRGPSAHLVGEWGDDGYEWLEHPPNSGRWYWRDEQTGEWQSYDG